MKKTPTLFRRDFDTRGKPVLNQVTPGCEWVLNGEGLGRVKWDGTCCLVRDGALFRRFDRKVRRDARGEGPPWTYAHFRDPPRDWEPCEPAPDLMTGHWPGWVPVNDGPNDHLHRAGFDNCAPLADGTYELCGPRINRNPHRFPREILMPHAMAPVVIQGPCDFDQIRRVLVSHRHSEGIVWHHPDGRKAKVKRRDFGLQWPPERG